MVQRRRLNNGGYGGTLANIAGGALQMYTGGNYRNYRRAAKLGMRAAQAGARGIQRAYRAYKARSGVNASIASRRSAAASAGGNSASHGGTVRYGSSSGASRSRRPRYRRGRGPRRKGRGSYRRKGRSGGGVVKYLTRMLTTPQITKVTRANNYVAQGPGVRCFYAFLVNSRDNMADMWNRRPQPFFSANATNPATAVVQTGYSNTHKCHITSWTNKFYLQNRSNWDMELKVYECIVRRDHSFTHGVADMTAWVKACFVASDSNTESKGANQPGYAGAGDALTVVWQNPLYTPYMSHTFCSSVRIIKTTSYKIGMNDYVTHYVKVNPKKFNGADLSTSATTGYQENIGGWTKFLLFSWVGGPIDDNVVGAGAHQSKAQCDLYVQADITQKFYFEPRGEQLYNIASSNATGNQLGVETTNLYSTLDAPNYVAPASSIEQSSAADDVPATHP